MTKRRAGVLIWLSLMVCWPLPLLGLGDATVPTVRYAQLASALGVLGLQDGTQGMVAVLLGLFWGHVLVYSLILGSVAALVAHFGLGGRDPRERRRWVWGLVGVIVIAATLQGYDSPFHHSNAHASLWTLYR
jgi:hypothetical protein